MSPTKLFEKTMEEIPDKAGNDFIDRLSLRIFCVPSLLTYLDDISREDNIAELVFRNLPNAAIEAVFKLVGHLPTEVYAFSKEDKDYTAFKIDITNAVEDEERQKEQARKDRELV